MSNAITDVPGIAIGHAEDVVGLTGCTVILPPKGTVCGVDVRGSAPGTRETDLLSPINVVSEVHAICLTGGSAFGLDAATGVMRYLEEQDMGLHLGVATVPVVPAAVLFDLTIGDSKARPTAEMGYAAASAAKRGSVAEGNVGAGCGATVGKLAGMEGAMKSGLGTASVTLSATLSVTTEASGPLADRTEGAGFDSAAGGQLSRGHDLVVGAIVAVNAVGNVHDVETGRVIAGARGLDNRFIGLEELLARQTRWIPRPTNTTIGAIATNAKLTKAEATKVAQMAHDGLARTINPIHTMNDGDTIFALATGDVESSVDVVGTLAAQVLAEAVVRAVRAAESAGGLPALRDLGSL